MPLTRSWRSSKNDPVMYQHNIWSFNECKADSSWEAFIQSSSGSGKNSQLCGRPLFDLKQWHQKRTVRKHSHDTMLSEKHKGANPLKREATWVASFLCTRLRTTASGWFCPHRGWLSSSVKSSLETPLQTDPQMCLLGDYRPRPVDSEDSPLQGHQADKM